MFRNADPKEQCSAVRQAAGSRGQCRSGKVLNWTFPGCITAPSKPQTPVSQTVLPGSQRMRVGRKRPHCQLCRVMEMLCRRSLSRITDLPTSLYHTHSSTDLVTKHLWALQEPKNQHKCDLTKAIYVEHWRQASGLQSRAWVAVDWQRWTAFMGLAESGFHPSCLPPQLGRTWDLTDSLGFYRLSASSFSL